MAGGNDVADDTHNRHLLAQRLAREAGELVMAMRYSPKTQQTIDIESKTGSSDLVTSADLASQKHIFDTISKTYPSHRLIGEEDAEEYGKLDERPTWIVDAIDGTTNFVNGIGDFCVSIAFAIEGMVEIGVVFNPIRREMFTGIRGKGAYLNDKEISASKCNCLSDAIILTEWGYVRSQPGAGMMLAVNERLLVSNCRGIRQLGSGALDICFVAMGRADGVYCGVAEGFADSWKIWDYAAASLIAEEAGAVLTNITGEPFDVAGKSMVCATPGLLDQLLKVINNK